MNEHEAADGGHFNWIDGPKASCVKGVFFS